MANVRAKFRCASIEFHADPAASDSPRTYTFSAVRFTKATPWGDIKMRVDNPAVSFEIGKLYYLDFTPAAE